MRRIWRGYANGGFLNRFLAVLDLCSLKKGAAILLLGTLLSIVLAVATVSVIWSSYRAATEEWSHRVAGLSEMIAAHAKQSVESSDEILLAVVETINALDISSVEEFRRRLATQEVHESLASRIKGAPHIALLALIDGDGMVANNSLKFVPPYPFSQWDALKDELLDDKNVDKIFSNAFHPVIAPSGQWIIAVGRKVFSKSGMFLGAVGVGIKGRHFGDFYSHLPINDGYCVNLLTQNGLQLAGSANSAGEMGKKTPIREFDAALKQKDRAVFVTSDPTAGQLDERLTRLIAMRRIPEISMVAVVGISGSAYLAQWKQNALVAGVGGGAISLFVLLLTFGVYKLFVEMEAARAEAVAHAGAKTRFLSAMSHEIRTPLNAIAGSAELIAAHDLPTEVGKFASLVHRSSRHLLFLVNNILDFARFEAGKPRVEVAPFELLSVLNTIMDIARSLPGAEGLAVQMTVRSETPKILLGDFGILTQIILNLVGNAIKFTEKGSVVLRVDYEPGPGLLVVAVSDTGCGIAPSEEEAIFRPFERGQAVKSGVEGTGLGLTIVRQLTAALGGTISLRSVCGVGSTFTVKLPMQAASLQVQAETREAPQTSASLHILVAEDVAANRMVIEALLRRQGHSVHLAANGLEALDAIRKWNFDAILMDVQMPEMDGIEATRAIRRMPKPLGDMPIIGLTAFVEPEQHALMLEAGMNLCLTKPVQIPNLVAALAGAGGASSTTRKDPRAEDVFLGDPSLRLLFLSEVQAGRDELAACLSVDEAGLSRIAHKLRGLFATFDMPALAQLAATAEASRRGADAQKLLEAIDALPQPVEQN